MNRTTLSLSAIALTMTLAACGGGGGAAGGGALPPSLPPIIITPTPPATVTFSGNVTQLSGSLSSSATATPAPNATPTGSVGISGATVYLTTGATVLASNATPAAGIVAQATTASDGSFSVTIPSSALGGSATLAVVATKGTGLTPNGTTNLNYTVTRKSISASQASIGTLYLDTLTTDEQSAFAALNAARNGAGISGTVLADTVAQEIARLAVAQRVGTPTCGPWPGAIPAFSSLGALDQKGQSWEDTAGPDWTSIITYFSPWNDTSVTYAGFAAKYNATPCGTGFIAPINYFDGEYLSST